MKLFKTAKVLSLALACLLFVHIQVSAAPIINDIGENHWAYSYVLDVLNTQFMNLNQDGKFLPNDPINKFDTVRVLARMTGYKYDNLTTAESSYYESVYQRYKALLDSYGTKFQRWNSSTDREIAFLLDKEVLVEEDLYQFVIMDQSGSEALRALSREEAAVFITKVIGKKNEALSMSYSYDFLDDTSINSTYKPYVYYFKAKQVVVGENGNFYPKSAVTRVALAVMISKGLQLSGGSVPQATADSFYTQPTAASVKVEMIVGTIDKILPTLNAIQVIGSDGKTHLCKIAQTATISINGVPSTSAMLGTGMSVIGTLTNNEFTELKAENTAVPLTPFPTVQPTSQPTSYESKTIEGIVSDVITNANGQQILIQRNVVSPRGEIVPEILTYTLIPGCSVLRGDTAVSFADITRGEIVMVTTNGDAATYIVLEERNINIEGGTITEKRYLESSHTPYFVIQTKNGKVYELKITETTQIWRGAQGEVSYDQIRIGDVVDAIAEYDKLISINAYGVIATQDGTVEDIHIGKKASSISILADDNTVYQYTIIPDLVDVYSVKLNDRVRLRLDSWEVENISILQVATTSYVTGFIQFVRAQSLTVQDISKSPGMTKEVYIDSSTVIVNSRTGEKVPLSYLSNGMKIYANISSTTNAPAKTIIILID